jgi:hypothetical protein
MSKKITAHLMGGLGNQMFQYAAARAIAHRNNIDLYLDDYNGFVRDIVYMRKFELDQFPIQAKIARVGLIYWIEKVRKKLFGQHKNAVTKNFFWTTLEENEAYFINDVSNFRITVNTWMHGYWQSERYFEDIKDIVFRDLMPKAPEDIRFLEMAKIMESCNSVSLGVRLYEEVPGETKDGVGGITSIKFFNESAKRLSKQIENSEFFIFCTTNSPELEKLDLPGKIHLISHDNGFEGTMARLWLYTKCKHHIIANSSFYWWGAWLSEMKNKDSVIIASPIFSNNDAIPERWLLI